MSETSLTIRVSRSTHEFLRELASKSNATITALIDEAVHDLHRKKFWADFNAACEAVEADPEALAELRREDEVWETTVADDLEKEIRSDEPQEKRRGKPLKG